MKRGTRSADAASRLQSTPGSGFPALSASDPAPWLIAAFVLVAFVDLFNLGYFSDDFIFLDAANRFPFLDVLSGRHGIWPWYRPLSRELYFEIASLAGPAGPIVARLFSLAALVWSADSLRRILKPHVGEAVARGAVLLFLAHGITRFLAGWLSGFQDLLALALALAALRLHREERFLLAALCAGLAALAKESGALAFALIALDQVIEVRPRPGSRAIAAYASAFVAVCAIHVAARLAWGPHVAEAAGAGEMLALLGLALHVLLPWISPPGPAGGLAWGSAVLAAGMAAALIRPVRERTRVTRASVRFIVAALVVSLLPALLPTLITHHPPHAHFFFAGIPWACALIAVALRWLLPDGAWRWALPLIAGALIWNQSARAIDLDAPAGWTLTPLAWDSAQRIEARTRRMEADLRRLLPTRPESLLVAYVHVPAGALLQTGDGPATRVLLGDRTLRAEMLEDLPAEVFDRPGHPVVLLDYDPVSTHSLVRLDPTDPRLLPMLVSAILGHRSRVADALASYRFAGDSAMALPGYLRAMNRLLAEGPSSARAGFARDGLADSGRAATRSIGALRADADSACRLALAQPLTASAHRKAADALAAAHLPMLEALELAAAVALDPRRGEEALRLGRLLASHDPVAAKQAFERVLTSDAAPELREAASAELSRLGSGH